MVTQVRIYTVKSGMMDSWIKHFNTKIVPTSAKFGVKVLAAYANREQDEFIWVRRFDSEDALKQYEESERELQIAVQQNPQSDFNWYFAGWRLLLRGKYEASLPYFYKAVELNRRNPNAQRALGSALARSEAASCPSATSRPYLAACAGSRVTATRIRFSPAISALVGSNSTQPAPGR